MSNTPPLAEQIATRQQKEEGQIPKKPGETLGEKSQEPDWKIKNTTLGIYLPRETVQQLKDLAHTERTSVSKILYELIAKRIAAGPRTDKGEQNDIDDRAARDL